MSRDPIVMAPVTLNLCSLGSVTSAGAVMLPSWVPPQGPLRLYGAGHRDSLLTGQEFSSPKANTSEGLRVTCVSLRMALVRVVRTFTSPDDPAAQLPVRKVRCRLPFIV